MVHDKSVPTTSHPFQNSLGVEQLLRCEDRVGSVARIILALIEEPYRRGKFLRDRNKNPFCFEPLQALDIQSATISDHKRRRVNKKFGG
jgi:hypothetical protein